MVKDGIALWVAIRGPLVDQLVPFHQRNGIPGVAPLAAKTGAFLKQSVHRCQHALVKLLPSRVVS
jgi:hypothetical protein